MSFLVKCLQLIPDDKTFGSEELFYMFCGGLITICFQHIINNNGWTIYLITSIETLLIQIIVPLTLLLMTVWFVFGMLLSLYLLLIAH